MTEFRGYNEQDLGIENNAASTNRKVRFIYHCYNNEKVTAERFAGRQTNFSPIACRLFVHFRACSTVILNSPQKVTITPDSTALHDSSNDSCSPAPLDMPHSASAIASATGKEGSDSKPTFKDDEMPSSSSSSVRPSPPSANANASMSTPGSSTLVSSPSMSPPPPPQPATEVVDENKSESPMEESPSTRLAREIEESEALARQLMAEEAQYSFQLQYDMLQGTSTADMPMADLVAVQRLLRADEEQDQVMHGETDNGDNESQDYASDDQEDDNEDQGEDENEPGYEDLIELGRAIGDVKAERWAFKAQSVIDSLPCVVHNAAAPAAAEKSSASSSASSSSLSSSSSASSSSCPSSVEAPCYDPMCIFCQDNYVDGDRVRILPCKHAFHADCVDEWLKTKDTCPICKQSVVLEENKADEDKMEAASGTSSSDSSEQQQENDGVATVLTY